MSGKVHNLTYRGELSGLDGDGKTISFVTRHVENIPTALFQIDGESNKLTTIPLEFEATCLLRTDDKIWIGGQDGSLHFFDESNKKVVRQKIDWDQPVTAMARLADSHLAVVTGSQVAIVSLSKKVTISQILELDGQGSAIASNPDGDWLVAGTDQGTAFVFESEEAGSWKLSESEKLHDGCIRALLFEPDELRFFSAGDDRKLLLTHARGRLEPEDRGRKNVHENRITDMVLAGDERLITGGADAACKSWARAGATKPQTQAKDLAKVSHLAIVEVHKRKNLVVGCEDNSIRLFLIKDDERIGDLLLRFNDLYVRTREMLTSSDPSVRGQALQELAEFDDRKSAEALASQVNEDSDHKLRLTAIQLLSKSGHAQLSKLIEPFLSHDDEPVREFALDRLAELNQDTLVELYRSAIRIGHSDIGMTSVNALVKIATQKSTTETVRNQAQSELVSALDSDNREIRNSAILGLEKLFDKKSTRANLLTLESKSTDSRRKGLIRLFQRGLLKDASAEAGLRRAVNDQEPDVRKTAFLVSVLSRPALTKTLRQRDKELDRQLTELEKFSFEDDSGKQKKGRK